MGNIELAGSFLRRYRILNFIYMLEMALIMVVFTLAYNYIQTLRYDLDSIDSFSYRAVYYSSMNYEYEKFDFTETQKKIEQMPGFLAWSVTQQKSAGEICAITYDRYSKELFKEIPKEGVWFTEYSGDSSYIPCVAIDRNNGFRVNETFERNGKKFIVTGLVDRNIYLFWLEGSSGTTPYCSLWGFRETNLETEQPMIIYGEEKDAAAVLSEKDARRFVYFDKDISQKQYEENVKEMRKLGGVQTLEQIREYSYQEFLFGIKEYLPYIAVFTGIVLLGLFSLSVLNGRIMEKRFSVYYLCGCRRSKSFGIYACYVMFLIVGGILLYALLLAGLGWQKKLDMSLYGVLFCPEDMIVVLLAAVCCFVITCLPVLMIYKRLSPVVTIKNL